MSVIKSSLSFRELFQISTRADVICFIALSMISLCFSLVLSSHAHPLFFEDVDVWYGSDIVRVFRNINPDNTLIHRTHTHPLFSIIFIPLTKVSLLIGLEVVQFGRLLIAASGSITCGALFVLLRSSQLSTMSSFIGVCIFLCSGAFIFWWSVIETFPIGGALISLVFLLIAVNLKSMTMWVFATPLTFGITVTNWVICIIGVFQTFSRIKAIQVLIIGLVMSAVLYALQNHYFQTNQGFVDQTISEQQFLVFPENAHQILHYSKIYIKRAIVFISSPAMVAQGYVELQPKGQFGLIYGFFNYSWVGWLGVLCWFVLILHGASNLLSSRKNNDLANTLLTFIAFQFLLHLFYGDNPFLYCAHYVTSLVIVASFSLLGSHSRAFQIIAIVFCICAFYSNLVTYHDSINMIYEANK